MVFSCAGCGERIKFQAKQRADKIIANVYRAGKWIRTEHWHVDHYLDAGEPYGTATER